MTDSNTPKLLFPTSYHIQALKKQPTTSTTTTPNIINSTDINSSSSSSTALMTPSTFQTSVKQEVYQRNVFPPSTFDADFYSHDNESESRPYSPTSSIASSEITDDISMNFLNFDGPEQQYDNKAELDLGNAQNFQNNPMGINTNGIPPQTYISTTTANAAVLNQMQGGVPVTTIIGNSNLNQLAIGLDLQQQQQLNLGIPSNTTQMFPYNGTNQIISMDWMNLQQQNQMLNSPLTFHNGTKNPARTTPSRSSSVKPEVEIKPEIDDSTNEKLKKRRESHNAVERRRRDNINERINELSILVPDCIDPTGTAKPNKGHVLRKSADYIRYLQEANRKLEQLVQQQQLQLQQPQQQSQQQQQQQQQSQLTQQQQQQQQQQLQQQQQQQQQLLQQQLQLQQQLLQQNFLDQKMATQ